ncbi:unnamed protein product [Acanthoscelides obtectus]|uniref:Transposase n=1 Tax=Acanthoscelides obtectus TaxID=200917 RepID=A0A9P0MDW0_ACAOB|nr:unnamed protein product [Acanthoscelides obtectus]CAK1682336.1 hypothetical protein AOBTE_LOCUS33576 [Acanthoscelides obtectus]
MSIVLRYCYQTHIYKDFMGFVDCYSNFDEDRMESKLTGSHETLRKVMRDMGFRWRKTKNNRKILMEKPYIQVLRRSFLRNIKHYREENRPIIYMDETYIHSSHTHAKNWGDNTIEGFHKPVSKGPRLIIVHAGGEMGFINNACLQFKSGTKSGDYHSEMNYIFAEGVMYARGGPTSRSLAEASLRSPDSYPEKN